MDAVFPLLPTPGPSHYGKRPLACTRAHLSATIRETGAVFFCCHASPQLGNVRETSLEEIMCSDRVAALLASNNAGFLPCQPACPHVHHFVPPNSLSNSDLLLDDLLLMVALDCNIACTMCYQTSDRNRFAHAPERRLSADLLWKQVPFHRIKRLVIQGGEPTIIPESLDLLDKLTRMQSRAPVVNLITNGLSLPPVVLACVRKHSEFIYISINGATPDCHERVNRGSSWQTVIDNIGVLRAMRAATQAHFTIVGGYTVVPSNIRELPQFIATYPSIGFDSISFNYDTSTCRLLARDAQLKSRLQSQIKETIGDNSARLGHFAKLAELGLIT